MEWKEYLPELINGGVAILCVIIPLILTPLFIHRKAVSEKKNVESTLCMAEKFAHNARVLAALKNVIRDTNVDRIVLLFERGGDAGDRYVTATYQCRGDDHHFEFNDVRIDAAYESILAACENGQHVLYKTGSNPNTVLDNIYVMESISEAMIESIIKEPSGYLGKVKHSFISYATHDKEGLTQRDKTIVKLATDQLRGLPK